MSLDKNWVGYLTNIFGDIVEIFIGYHLEIWISKGYKRISLDMFVGYFIGYHLDIYRVYKDIFGYLCWILDWISFGYLKEIFVGYHVDM